MKYKLYVILVGFGVVRYYFLHPELDVSRLWAQVVSVTILPAGSYMYLGIIYSFELNF